jgi:protein-S-isoprenylcysteine O-methyltransferase Ste14
VWNVLGLVLIAPGLIWLGWCVYLHFARSASRVEVAAAAPPYLLTDGPYRWSRNPMYVAGMAIWTGMAVFYGSIPILIVGVLFWSAVVLLAVPYEERHLRARLGEAYDRYSRSVPRWLGSREKIEEMDDAGIEQAQRVSSADA